VSAVTVAEPEVVVVSFFLQAKNTSIATTKKIPLPNNLFFIKTF